MPAAPAVPALAEVVVPASAVKPHAETPRLSATAAGAGGTPGPAPGGGVAAPAPPPGPPGPGGGGAHPAGPHAGSAHERGMVNVPTSDAGGATIDVGSPHLEKVIVIVCPPTAIVIFCGSLSVPIV